MQYGFYFDHRLCVKCHACEIACKAWNEVEEGPRWREVVKVSTGTFPGIREINVSLACMHCGYPPCRDACPVDAISKDGDGGIVVVDAAKCIGCGFCVWACPFNAPQLGADGKMQKCNFCQTPGRERPLGMPRACEEVCPTGAIHTGTMAERSAQGRESAAMRLLGGEALPSLAMDPGES
ncbi:MAG: 4Fe-4S dicluster domain-containing protein [Rhodospirillales bacterium]|jgi:Fe-S-cluster-containing dehydrogenase component|nr:4Fe-4S dicluster domain-containing protein [Rhodospirillales bacterium]MDP7241821.1 4Fe-4S dicluster domain-containing protein [Rhodospirillales bacterium]|tara:strand:+ start:279 stop:818 length:540 start_codon:yes stop_codon:yes gene_type:complete